MRTPSSLSGLRSSLNYFVFLVYWYFISFYGKQRKNCFLCLFFLVIFTKNEVTSPLLTSICVKDKTQHFVTVFFFFTYDLYFPSIIISSSELWPIELRMADRKDSASKKKKKDSASEDS